jgi:hypothetical protein
MKEKAMLAVRGTRAAIGESLNPQNWNSESRDTAETPTEEAPKSRAKKLKRPE